MVITQHPSAYEFRWHEVAAANGCKARPMSISVSRKTLYSEKIVKEMKFVPLSWWGNGHVCSLFWTKLLSTESNIWQFVHTKVIRKYSTPYSEYYVYPFTSFWVYLHVALPRSTPTNRQKVVISCGTDDCLPYVPHLCIKKCSFSGISTTNITRLSKMWPFIWPHSKWSRTNMKPLADTFSISHGICRYGHSQCLSMRLSMFAVQNASITITVD